MSGRGPAEESVCDFHKRIPFEVTATRQPRRAKKGTSVLFDDQQRGERGTWAALLVQGNNNNISNINKMHGMVKQKRDPGSGT